MKKKNKPKHSKNSTKKKKLIIQDLNVLSIADFDWSVEEQQTNNSLMDGLSKKTRIKCTNMPAEKN